MSVGAKAKTAKKNGRRSASAQVPDFHSVIGKDIRRIAIRIVILYKLAHQQTNYYSLVKEMQKAQIKKAERHSAASGATAWMGGQTSSSPAMIKSEIYNTISALEKSKYITAQKRTSGSRIIKYYKITPSGIKVLKETQDTLARTVKEMSRIIGE